MEHSDVLGWVDAYERAWRSPGTETLGEIFTEGASYLQGPWDEPVVGLPAIAEMWEAERAGPDEAFDMSCEVVAVDGDTAVVRAEVRYGPPHDQEWRDLWILRFEADGRCRWFEEWPIAPSG
ncbi:YybH family protein [Phytohabitans kaempferiae]|uniref:YybH family protein n=1 Tax=Phytohabitans kaempferiae TaxID=1620943 RepID=A0ABV6M489_9ACTN